MVTEELENGLQKSDKIVVGKVLETSPHPDAEKLTVCRVDVGAEEPLQIICGAKNVAPGQKVPVALHGAKLPGGTKIKRGKLRGLVSQGMICAQDELGFEREIDGIWVLPEEAVIGESVPFKVEPVNEE